MKLLLDHKKNKKIVDNNARKLYSILVNICYNDYKDITDEENERMGKKYVPKNLFINNQRLIEQKNKSRSENAIAERVKLRKQKNLIIKV